ncbi:hypothetical protein LO763_11775 [Glycomyces sp. A-F 0318]|uniref:hypothetical protein n=1 Tax=Glycomyces amatae TaxID=2881355 RepID=UPI001E5F586C|nr:hypothetical protein [Glycomyces amatae]MCD0444301.1 hypothetical protein [Glycomyces amatae]
MQPAATPLQRIAAAFDHHAHDPHLTVPGADLKGLPGRDVGLSELKGILTGETRTREVDDHTSDTVWAYLVDRARTEPLWVTISAGLALPGLRNAARRVSWIAPPWAEHADIEASCLEGFTKGLARADTRRPHLARRLCQQGYIAARHYARELNRYAQSLASVAFESHPPTAPAGHMDFVLADAVRQEVITVEEADLIGTTRIDGQRLTAYATAHSLTRPAADHRRRTAERRLTTWLTDANGRTGQSR